MYESEEEEKSFLRKVWEFIKKDIAGNTLTDEDLIAGTLPIGFAGGVGVIGKIATGVKAGTRGTKTYTYASGATKTFSKKTGKLVGTTPIIKGGIGAGLIQGLGIAGLTIPAATAKLAVKGAMGIAGLDGIMVWMASDNVLTGTAFTLKKLRESVEMGAITHEEALKETRLVQQWINAARSVVETSAKFNPFIMPFKNILLINADKAQKDFDLEVKLIRNTEINWAKKKAIEKRIKQ